MVDLNEGTSRAGTFGAGRLLPGAGVTGAALTTVGLTTAAVGAHRPRHAAATPAALAGAAPPRELLGT